MHLSSVQFVDCERELVTQRLIIHNYADSCTNDQLALYKKHVATTARVYDKEEERRVYQTLIYLRTNTLGKVT